MNTNELVQAIDAEIARLKEARTLLSGGSTVERVRKAPVKTRGKRTLSEEARKRIAEGQRKRWAKARKA